MILDEMQLAFIGGLREYKKEKNGTVGCGSQEEMQVTWIIDQEWRCKAGKSVETCLPWCDVGTMRGRQARKN